MASRVDIYRAKEVGCRWAAELVARNEHRVLLTQIAEQYRNLAEELELLGRITQSPPPPTP